MQDQPLTRFVFPTAAVWPRVCGAAADLCVFFAFEDGRAHPMSWSKPRVPILLTVADVRKPNRHKLRRWVSSTPGIKVVSLKMPKKSQWYLGCLCLSCRRQVWVLSECSRWSFWGARGWGRPPSSVASAQASRRRGWTPLWVSFAFTHTLFLVWLKHLKNPWNPTGIDFQMKTLTVGSTTITLQLWDTAGQERSVPHTHEPCFYFSQLFVDFYVGCMLSPHTLSCSVYSGSAALLSNTTAEQTASWPCTTWRAPPPSPRSEGGCTLWRWARKDHMDVLDGKQNMQNSLSSFE